MSLLSDFYIAKPEDAARYDVEQSLPDAEHAEFKGLTYMELAELWAILQNVEATPAHADAFESVLVIDGGQRLINRFPAEFVAALSTLEVSSASAVAAKWAQIAELEEMGCEAADVMPIIEALSRLAQAAQRSSNKSLYLWMCV